jgi:hypothetical protein
MLGLTEWRRNATVVNIFQTAERKKFIFGAPMESRSVFEAIIGLDWTHRDD